MSNSSKSKADMNVLPQAVARGSARTPQTRQLDFVSSINGRAYRLQIALPVVAAPSAGYPVLFLVDGDMHFGGVAASARMRSYGGELLPAIVVGIGYPESEDDFLAWLRRRNTDLTPTSGGAAMHQSVTRQLGGIAIDPFGGADAFLSVITDEIAPLVAGEANVDTSHAILFGHSLGGLFTLYTAFTRPTMFATYLALSPSIWWDNKVVLTHESAFVDSIKANPAALRLFLGVGAYEQSPEKVPQLVAQEVRDAAMVDNVTALVARLSPQRAPGFVLTSKVYAGQTHMGVASTALSDVLEFALANPTHG